MRSRPTQALPCSSKSKNKVADSKPQCPGQPDASNLLPILLDMVKVIDTKKGTQRSVTTEWRVDSAEINKPLARAKANIRSLTCDPEIEEALKLNHVSWLKYILKGNFKRKYVSV